MNFRNVHTITASTIGTIAFGTYLLTAQSSISFWDCAEFADAAYTLGIPHPPGAPLFSILGRFFVLMLPFAGDVAFRVSLISVLASAFTILLTYLTIVRLIVRWKSTPASVSDILIVCGSGAVGALTFAFSDTFWFSAGESEVYASSMFFIALVIHLSLVWYDRADEPQSERYLFLIAFLMGLSVAIHQLSTLPFFSIGLILYFRDREVTPGSLLGSAVIIAGAFFLFWLSLTSWIPRLYGAGYLPLIIIFVALMLFGAYYAQRHQLRTLQIACLSILLALTGYTTYIQIVIRADSGPPLNHSDASTPARFAAYMGREQYDVIPSIFDRQWNREPVHVAMYRKYNSQTDYFLRYQVGHMFLRYYGWNFVGRAGDVQDAPVTLFTTETRWSPGDQFPNRYYALPLILGFIGLVFHWKKDWKFGLVFTTLLLMLGVAIMMQQNFAEPQTRERDTFFVGTFYTIALWIGLGSAAMLDMIERRRTDAKKTASHRQVGAALAALVLLVPVNMAVQNWDDHDRSGNYVPFDASYNLLQSVEQDAILFTNGDNDTHPLWYLQDVEGIRRDVRVVNIHLLNLPWYVRQLKTDHPGGAKAIGMKTPDEEIERLFTSGVVEWKTQQVDLPVDSATFRFFGVNDPALLASKKISWTLKSNLFERTIGIRPQDALLRDIVVESHWNRPLYFAPSVPNSNRIGLDDFLSLEGIAFRITPGASPDGFQLNDTTLLRHLAISRDQPSKERAFGFLFRNTSQPGMYYNPEEHHAIDNIRTVLMFSAITLNNQKRPDDAVKILAAIEKNMPESTFPTNERFAIDAARIYHHAGQSEKFERLIAPIEKQIRGLIQRGTILSMGPEASSQWQLLLDIVQTRNDPAQLSEIYKQMLLYYPQDTTLQQHIGKQLRQLNDSTIAQKH